MFSVFSIYAILVLFVALVAFGFFFGSGNVRALAVALPISGYVFSILPSEISSFLTKYIPETYTAFVILVSILIFVVSAIKRVARFDSSFANKGVILAPVSVIIFLLVISFQLFPSITAEYPSIINYLFGQNPNAFWALLLGIVALFII